MTDEEKMRIAIDMWADGDRVRRSVAGFRSREAEALAEQGERDASTD